MRAACIATLLLTAPVLAGGATNIMLTIDPAQSTADFVLCAVGNCDSDASTIAGQVVIDLDDTAAPSSISLRDYDFLLTEDLSFNINFLIGAIDISTTGLELMYPSPGLAFGPTAINGENMFTFFDVPAAANGNAAYTATGLACTLIEANGLSCTDAFILDELGEQTADSIVGIVAIDGNNVAVVLAASITLPIVPDDPDLAQLQFQGTIVAFGQLPVTVPGDFDDDGDADLFDYNAYLDCETGPGGALVEGCETFDFDQDNDVDVSDFAVFQFVFTG